MLIDWNYPQPVGLVANVPHLSEFPDLTTIPINDVPEDFRTVYMVYNNKGPRSHAVNLFLKYIEDNHPFLTQ